MLGLEQLAELLEKNRVAAKARVKEFSIGGRLRFQLAARNHGRDQSFGGLLVSGERLSHG